MSREAKIRVLLSKIGLDGHNRGLHVVARALREGGMEVVLGEMRSRPMQIVETAIQEDVDVIGLSILSGSPMALIPRVVSLLKEKGADDIPVVAGGIFLDSEIAALKEAGVTEVFLPGSNTDEIAAFVRDLVAKKRVGIVSGMV